MFLARHAIRLMQQTIYNKIQWIHYVGHMALMAIGVLSHDLAILNYLDRVIGNFLWYYIFKSMLIDKRQLKF